MHGRVKNIKAIAFGVKEELEQCVKLLCYSRFALSTESLVAQFTFITTKFYEAVGAAVFGCDSHFRISAILMHAFCSPSFIMAHFTEPNLSKAVGFHYGSLVTCHTTQYEV